MSINVNTGFALGAAAPIDDRLVLTKEEMLNINENVYPSVYLCVCADDGKLYTFNKDNEANDTTGKFRSTGGIGATIDDTMVSDTTVYSSEKLMEELKTRELAPTCETLEIYWRPGSGSDDNDGLTSSTCIKTVDRELFNRLGVKPSKTLTLILCGERDDNVIDGDLFLPSDVNIVFRRNNTYTEGFVLNGTMYIYGNPSVSLGGISTKFNPTNGPGIHAQGTRLEIHTKAPNINSTAGYPALALYNSVLNANNMFLKSDTAGVYCENSSVYWYGGNGSLVSGVSSTIDAVESTVRISGSDLWDIVTTQGTGIKSTGSFVYNEDELVYPDMSDEPNIVQYSMPSQLGLDDTSCTAVQLAQAMRVALKDTNKSGQGIFNNGGQTITDAPTEYGLLHIETRSYDRVLIRYDGISGSTFAGSFIGKISSADGAFSSVEWIRMDNHPKVYATLESLGLDASANMDDVLSAMTTGDTFISNTTIFTNYQTIFPYQNSNDAFSGVIAIKSNVQRSYVKWFRKDGFREAIANFNSSGVIAGWVETQKYLNDGNSDDGTVAITGENQDSTYANGVLPETLGMTRDVMTWPNGTYRISHGVDLTNTPDGLQAGRLEHYNLKKWGGNHSPSTATYAERMSVWYAYTGDIYTRATVSGATAGTLTSDTGWRRITQNTFGLVTNSQNFKLSITKKHSVWYGFFKLEYMYGTELCEVDIGITSTVGYRIVKGPNAIDSITYTMDGANITFGINFVGKAYGTQVIEMPSEFGTINSLTAETFTGENTATLVSGNTIITQWGALGLSPSSSNKITIGTIISAIASKKILDAYISLNISNFISDCPVKYGILTINVGETLERCFIKAIETCYNGTDLTTEQSGEYQCLNTPSGLRGGDTANWVKISGGTAAYNTADTAVTFDATGAYKPKNMYYRVVNGICYVYGAVIPVSAAGSNNQSTITTNLPTPSFDRAYYRLSRSGLASSSADLAMELATNTSGTYTYMYFSGGTNTDSYRFSISYPVKL